MLAEIKRVLLVLLVSFLALLKGFRSSSSKTLFTLQRVRSISQLQNTPIIDAEIVSDISNIKADIVKESLLSVRGEIASDANREEIEALVSKLESFCLTDEQKKQTLQNCIGNWELIYSSTYLFRSSPFFMAARAVCAEGAEADRFNLFCKLHREALAFTSIGHVRQRITEDSLVSEFETTGAVVPGLPISVKGTIVSSAKILSADNNTFQLKMETVKIMSSNVPVLQNLLESSGGLNIEALGSFLQSNIASYRNPVPEFRCYFADESFRVCRDQDDNIFVYSKIQ